MIIPPAPRDALLRRDARRVSQDASRIASARITSASGCHRRSEQAPCRSAALLPSSSGRQAGPAGPRTQMVDEVREQMLRDIDHAIVPPVEMSTLAPGGSISPGQARSNDRPATGAVG
jgi:hypothetical protein